MNSSKGSVADPGEVNPILEKKRIRIKSSRKTWIRPWRKTGSDPWKTTRIRRFTLTFFLAIKKSIRYETLIYLWSINIKRKYRFKILEEFWIWILRPDPNFFRIRIHNPVLRILILFMIELQSDKKLTDRQTVQIRQHNI